MGLVRLQYGGFGKEPQILLKYPQHSINISNRIVDVKGDAKTVVTAGAYDIFLRPVRRAARGIPKLSKCR
jgi:hypothetical protein